MATLLTVVFNTILGVLGTAIVASQISSGKSISFENGVNLSLDIHNMGLVLYIVLLVPYFLGAKKLWGKTVGGLLTDKLLGKKK